jgi:predicted nucleic acid-binding protein
MLEDQAGIFPAWLQLVKQYDVQGKKVHDARLVAVMQTHSISHLLTFNVDDFHRFAGITAVHPSESQS